MSVGCLVISCLLCEVSPRETSIERATRPRDRVKFVNGKLDKIIMKKELCDVK